MRRALVGLAAAAVSVGLLGAPAGAATTTTTMQKSTTTTASGTTKTTKTTKARHHYVVVSGTFRSRALADKRVADLAAKGDTGFSLKAMTTKHRTAYRVQRTFATRAAALAELRAVRKDGFHARLALA